MFQLHSLSLFVASASSPILQLGERLTFSSDGSEIIDIPFKTQF